MIVSAPKPKHDLPLYWQPVRIKPWHVRYGMGYNWWHHINSAPRGLPSGDPAVCRRIAESTEKPLYLTPRVEYWMFNRLKEVANRTPRRGVTEEVKNNTCIEAYRRLTSSVVAFCDHSGNEENQSMILNSNVGAGLMRWGYALPNGNLAMKIGRKRIIAGKMCTPLMGIHLEDPELENKTVANSPFTIWWAVSSVVQANTKIEVCDPFPVMANNLSVGTPFFPFTTTYLEEFGRKIPVIYIESDWIDTDVPYYTRSRVNPYYKTPYKEISFT